MKHPHHIATTAIDYERMARVHPIQKATLTRAKKQGYIAVLSACREAVAEWNRIGAWPDDWHTWNIALRDAAMEAQFKGEIREGARLHFDLGEL